MSAPEPPYTFLCPRVPLPNHTPDIFESQPQPDFVQDCLESFGLHKCALGSASSSAFLSDTF